MSELYLISADPALRAAITEQWQINAPEGAGMRESAELPARFPAPPSALIVDATLIGEKTLPLLRNACGDERKTKLFVLGDMETESGLTAEFFSKPLRLGHLLARLQFHLQSLRLQLAPLAFDGYRFEPALRQIHVEETGAVIRLTEKEANLLEYLGRSKSPVSREELLAAIWGYDASIDTHTLETHLYRLRRKLDPEEKGKSLIAVEDGAYHLAVK